MKSRLAVTAMLVLGLVLSTGGAGLAISGISSDGSVGKAQYAAPDEGGSLGEERESDGQEGERLERPLLPPPGAGVAAVEQRVLHDPRKTLRPPHV